MNLKEHWNHVYQTKAHDDVSWYQSHPATSLKLIEACGVGKQEGILDVGGGASVLVDFLLDAGFTRLAVLAPRWGVRRFLGFRFAAPQAILLPRLRRLRRGRESIPIAPYLRAIHG